MTIKRVKVDKDDQKERPEESTLVVVEQKVELRRKLARLRDDYVHWNLCRRYGIQHAKNWYEHNAEKVTENVKAKILWDRLIRFCGIRLIT